VGEVKVRLITLALVALGAAAGPAVPRAAAQCASGDTFTFQVERPNGAPAKGLQVQVEAGGKSGIRRATDVVSDSGSILLCIRGASSGEMVDVRVTPASFRLLYPMRARLPLSREGSPSIVVCEAGHDCGLLSAAEVTALIQKARPRAQAMSAEDKAAFFRDWAAYARQLSQETKSDNAELLAALVRKERQIAASSRASVLLRRYVNRARELVVRFERHAERALAYPSAAHVQQINQAAVAYNPVYDEMNVGTDAYRKETSDYWSPEVSAEFRALIDEALEIHTQGIYPLNRTLTLINDCISKQPSCRRDAARAAVERAVQNAAGVTLLRLERFDKKTTEWLDSLDGRLFGDPAASPALPPERK
jgi:hypothetical protein